MSSKPQARFNSLPDWLSWQESLHSKEIDMGLSRVREVAARTGLLKPSARVISVAGTNGKGSCVTALQQLLTSAGRSVVSYTSPHLLRYNERIRLNGEPVSNEAICGAFERIDQARTDVALGGEISLTYFEFGTLAAIDVAVQMDTDFLLMEVGLGGRLDAVNILDAEIGIVTSIALDHEDWLGSDINIIGREKAGIYRPGALAICADAEAPQTVADYANEIGTRWLSAPEQLSWRVDTAANTFVWQGVDAGGDAIALQPLPLPQLPLPSVVAALQAYVSLGFEIGAKQRDVLGSLQLSGRAQQIDVNGVKVILDVGHNPAAAQYLVQQLQQSHLQVTGKTRCVLAMMSDKDRPAVLKPLLSEVDELYLGALPDNPRAASSAQLCADIAAAQPDFKALSEWPSVIDALTQALSASAQQDRVIVVGSFFTVAEALSYLQQDYIES